MGRPKKQPHDRVRKDAFSGPRYLVAAAKAAAGVQSGREFSPWLVTAIEEKLERDHKGLTAKVRAALQLLAARHNELNEADANALIDEMVRAAIAIEIGLTGGGAEGYRDSEMPGRATPKGTTPTKGKK